MRKRGRLAYEPWTVELHLALGAVAILGWIIAYTVLTRQIEAPQGSGREQASAPSYG